MEPLLHFMIPFASLMLIGAKVKKALPISALALIPDLDVLFHIHRSVSHSIVIPLVLIVPMLLLRGRTGNYILLAFGLFAVASHSILDLFTGYTPMLWPLYGDSIWLQTELAAHIGSSPAISLSAQLLVEPSSFQTFQSLDAPLVTSEGLALSVTLLTPLLLKRFRHRAHHSS